MIVQRVWAPVLFLDTSTVMVADGGYRCGNCGRNTDGEWAWWLTGIPGPMVPPFVVEWYKDQDSNWSYCLCSRCKLLRDLMRLLEEISDARDELRRLTVGNEETQADRARNQAQQPMQTPLVVAHNDVWVRWPDGQWKTLEDDTWQRYLYHARMRIMGPERF